MNTGFQVSKQVSLRSAQGFKDSCCLSLEESVPGVSASCALGLHTHNSRHARKLPAFHAGPLPHLTCVAIVSHGELQPILPVATQGQRFQGPVELHLLTLKIDGRLPLPTAVRVRPRPVTLFQVVPCNKREWSPVQRYPADFLAGQGLRDGGPAGQPSGNRSRTSRGPVRRALN